MRAAWQNQNLRRMGKYEPPPLKMLIRAFLRGNDLKAFLFHQSAFSAFPRLCHLKPTTATTTWNSKQKHHSAIFCFFRRYFPRKSIIVSFLTENTRLYYWYIDIYNQWYFSEKAERSIMEVSLKTAEVSLKTARCTRKDY